MGFEDGLDVLEGVRAVRVDELGGDGGVQDEADFLDVRGVVQVDAAVEVDAAADGGVVRGRRGRGVEDLGGKPGLGSRSGSQRGA